MKDQVINRTALAAAIALLCGVGHAQDTEETVEVDERIEAVDERPEPINEQVEAADERSEAIERQAEAADREAEALEEQAEAIEERTEAIEEQAEDARVDTEEPSDDQSVADRRDELRQSADEAIAQLRQQNDSAAALLDEAYGYAVFDTTKGGFIVTGAGGTGVARDKASGEETFMHLGSAGVGLGAGLENYSLVMLFEDEQTFNDFVSGQWDGSLSAQAAAGTEGAAAEEQFIDGIRAYRLTDVGLMAQVDVSGVRFWVSDRLNEGDAEQLAASGDQDASDRQPSDPERLDRLAEEHEGLATFVEAVRTAGLAGSLTGDTSYTLFAPTDEAWQSMSDAERSELMAPENRDRLVSLLRAHIVADDVDPQMARNIDEARTLDGGTVTIRADGEQLMIGDASVVESDIQSGNLRVYAIDQLLAEGGGRAVATADESDTDPQAQESQRSVSQDDTQREVAEQDSAEREVEVAVGDDDRELR